MTRYRLDLEYDGTDFWGWQIQPGSRTVQGVVEAALARILGKAVRVTGAGRTDRGCHAAGQVAHFDDEDGVRPPAVIARALAALLPADVRLKGFAVAPAGFHARYGAIERAYRYRIARRRSPLMRRVVWQLGRRLDLGAMNTVAGRLAGDHDFRGFAVAGDEPGEAAPNEGEPGEGAPNEGEPGEGAPGPRRGRCRVARAAWDVADGGYRFTIVADRFLTRMVRLLVGAQVEVGMGRRDPESVLARLDRPPYDPRPAAAPAAGLCLAWVRYGGLET